MQVTKIINIPDGRPVSTCRRITSDELQREIDYWRSNKILQKMLKEGLISKVEFNKIDALNRQSFSPMLAQLMV
ncbi:MAG TPA: SHOCT domain-containing protein [Desulfitobacteriaceae bacterium]|nr:SHOCT domain-containing protein [Desulfitobacteriaceae bacterium]